MATPAPEDRRLTRQAFLQEGLRWLREQMVGQVLQTTAPLTTRRYLRPPGAQIEVAFLALCTRCDACTAACPYEAISVHYGSGPPHDGTPIMADLSTHPCQLCPDTPCIPACPTGALMPVAQPQDIRIGTAVIDRLTCTAYRGSGCVDCVTACPLPDVAICIVEGLPQMIDAGCTGCGLCQQACPTDPASIQVWPSE